jgi:hypothetical protein
VTLIRRLPMVDCAVERGSGELTFKFGQQSFTYPDPCAALEQTSDYGRPFKLVNTPGELAGDTVMTDANGHAWVTDFARAGLAPPFWAYVELEAAIRFDWPKQASLSGLRELEECLTTGRFAKLTASDVEPPLRKHLRAIQQVRHLAARSVGGDPRAYHLALLFQAARRLTRAEVKSSLLPNELLPPAHWLLAAAMISRRLQADARQGRRRLSYDRATKTVRFDGGEESLSGKLAKIFEYLYDRPGRLCTREEITVVALKEDFDPMNASQNNTWNMAIHRLREHIEEDPEHPKFLITERGKGFLLILNPGEVKPQG